MEVIMVQNHLAILVYESIQLIPKPSMELTGGNFN